jgi:uncharacterized protein (DUF2141 family)
MKILFLASFAALALAAPAEAATLNVQLDGVRAAGGRLYVSVQSRAEFMQRSGTAGSLVDAPTAGTHRFTYEVPAGEYAVSVWHDDNGNGTFDSNEQHIPLDGWTMVNAAQIRAEPAFDQVSTVVGETPASIRLSMIYGR